MQDIRKYIDIVSEQPTPQVGDAIDLEFGDNTAVISTTIEKIGEDSVTVLADDKALKFISDLEEACGCEMEPEHEEKVEQDHEVGMGKSQMYHAMKNAKAIHDMLQQVSEREGIEGWVASKLTKASDYLKVVKDYLEYEMVQAGFDRNEQDVNEAVDKSALEAWYNKYNKYMGNNGDKLADGFFEAYLDTGILTDATETNEFAKAVDDVFGGDRNKAEEELFSNEDLKKKHLPITYAMHDEFEKIMGLPVGATSPEDMEDNVTKAAKILGDDIVGFGVAEDTRSFGQAFEAKYKGKTVKLGKPIRTGTDEPGKFKVYVKDPKTGNVKMVRFGHQGGGKNKDSKTMRIKKSNPARRKSFRARHNCDNPGPRTKARYWSCRAW